MGGWVVVDGIVSWVHESEAGLSGSDRIPRGIYR